MNHHDNFASGNLENIFAKYNIPLKYGLVLINLNNKYSNHFEVAYD